MNPTTVKGIAVIVKAGEKEWIDSAIAYGSPEANLDEREVALEVAIEQAQENGGAFDIVDCTITITPKGKRK